ncbi:sugar ABC transporter permease [Rhodovastum atsumiense]|uniref:Sugar ABC transporter permease n=1 Tax=Rhodovastum atsumiense TaxID=504468 RepID=A0A5M6IST6_9PROT|nr:sugar ABC transporter permease [Rhodovastum atsumiense]
MRRIPVLHAAPAPARRGGLQAENRRAARRFLAPAGFVLLLVAGWPLLRTVWLGFTDARLVSDQPPHFVGFENYAGLFADPGWWRAVGNTLIFALVSVAIETVLGLVIALVMNARMPGRGLVRAAVLVPWAIPTIVSAQLWNWMFNDIYGVINKVLLDLRLIGAPLAWTADPHLVLGAMILVDVWKTTPFVALLLLAGLQLVPEECYEAAAIDGAGPVQTFRLITLPLLRPALAVAVIFRLLDAMRVFDIIYVLTGNNENTMSMSMFARQRLVDFQDVGAGSAAATCLFLIIILLTALYIVVGRVRFDED